MHHRQFHFNFNKSLRIGLGTLLIVGVWVSGGYSQSQAFLDYINGRPATPNNRTSPNTEPTWVMFLGTGWHPDKLKQIEIWRQQGKWVNPLTGKPLDNAKVFVFGHPGPLREAARIVSDHLDIHALSSWEELKGQHFDFAMCHSNGCTNAIGAHRAGVLRVDHFFALGTDWTGKYFEPGDLGGASLTFFAMESDPIWKLPAPNWTRVTEDTPGLSFTIPFGPGNGAKVPRYPVINLKPPPGHQGTFTKPFRAHALVDSYFPSVQKWMAQNGSQQRVIANQLRQANSVPVHGDRNGYRPDLSGPSASFSSGCSPACGGGPGQPGPGSPGSAPGLLRMLPSATPLGGIDAGVQIKPEDFQ